MHCWDQKGPVPLDEQEAAGIANCRSADEIESLRYVLNRYFVQMDDGWYNKRMAEEVEAAEHYSDNRSRAGKISADVRKSVRERSRAIVKQVQNTSSTSVEHMSVAPSSAPSLALTPTLQENAPTVRVNSAAPTLTQEAPSESLSDAKQPSVPPCPYDKIVALWRECCPSLPYPRDLTAQRRAKMAARWREIGPDDQADGLNWLRKLFENRISTSPFLSGAAKPSAGRTKPFVATVDFVFRSEQTMQEILEGKYA
jgi:uncharacterized protein YdaU (DUF1376 family)